MTRILQIRSSLSGPEGRSNHLADRFVRRFRSARPDAERTAGQRRRTLLSDELVAELRAADVLVVGVPMYNFGIPSPLKAWFDHVARAGVTFRYTDQGPQGLLTGKRAVLLHTRGGSYAGTAADHQAPHVRQFLGFLGIEDVDEIFAEGLATEDAESGFARALAEAERLAAAARVAEAA